MTDERRENNLLAPADWYLFWSSDGFGRCCCFFRCVLGGVRSLGCWSQLCRFCCLVCGFLCAFPFRSMFCRYNPGLPCPAGLPTRRSLHLRMDIYADRSSFIIKWNNDDNEPALCAAQASSAASAASSGDTGVHALAEAPLLGAMGGTRRSSLIQNTSPAFVLNM